ncbi:hypothetical protein BDZ91DRAFT_852933 [Kalaharituber pfeilii]|nr:hypothetical protein BDZ91DRAFT_852933 [Kalaharituber pfeilii]
MANQLSTPVNMFSGHATATPSAQQSIRGAPRHLVAGINHSLSISTFISSRQYNSLPPLALQAPISYSLLHRFGEIVMAYGLQDVFGAHLIYNRFHPGGIADGSFVATTKVPLITGGRSDGRVGAGVIGARAPEVAIYNPSTTFTSPYSPGPDFKKMIWQSGIWELGIGSPNPTLNVDVNLVHGRLVLLSPGPPPAVLQTNSQQQYQAIIAASQHQRSAQQQVEQPRRVILGITHHFLSYEYEYGPLPPTLVTIPDSFWEDMANFIIDHGLETRLAIEILDAPDLVTGRTGVGRFVVEEYDPSRSRKATVVEVPGGKELSWAFSRGQTMNTHEGLGRLARGSSTMEEMTGASQPEVEIEVNLVRLGTGV